jgi:hypothetical protein
MLINNANDFILTIKSKYLHSKNGNKTKEERGTFKNFERKLGK